MPAPDISHPNRWLLAAGDSIVFLVFAAIGRMFHSMGSALDDVTATALPFLLAWFLVAPVTGAFRPDATARAGIASRRAALTWLLAFPLGYLIRAALLGYLAHYTFATVAGIFTLVTLTGWRALYALLAGRRNRVA